MMADRGPVLGLATLVAVLAGGVMVGGVLGVGPLAMTTPPDQVKDPREMIARSLQATLDAFAVHLDAKVTGTVTGAMVSHPEASVDLDGTTLTIDLRPKDAKTKSSIASPSLDISIDTVSSWDSLWYRTAQDATWTKASFGGTSAQAGVDINPLTLVDRLRSYLARPDLTPVVTEVPCAGASGSCHHIVLAAGTDPANILGALLPDENEAAMPEIQTTITLDTDAKSLRPAHLVLDLVSADSTVSIQVVIDTKDWDNPVPINEPGS
jgi:hypothetical protein